MEFHVKLLKRGPTKKELMVLRLRESQSEKLFEEKKSSSLKLSIRKEIILKEKIIKLLTLL